MSAAIHTLAILIFLSLGVLIDTAMRRAAARKHDDYDPLTRRLLCDAEWDRILAAVESDEQAEYRAAGGWR